MTATPPELRCDLSAVWGKVLRDMGCVVRTPGVAGIRADNGEPFIDRWSVTFSPSALRQYGTTEAWKEALRCLAGALEIAAE